ncbi:MAG: M48 family metallopeptidase [Magnetococcales bacterium]|nr:M48 family metallopeptidase [Magnetococcales bacterium]
MLLRITAGGEVEVRGGVQTTLAEAEGLLRHYANWLLNRLAHRQVKPAAGRPELLPGTALPFWGEELTLTPMVAADPRRRILREEHRLMVPTPSWPPEGPRQALESWYRLRAVELLPPRLAELAASMGVRHRRTTIRNQRRRWGSCSSLGDISLNWRLLWLPPELRDHVLIHELCHLDHPNHGPEFWRQVQRHDPDCQRRRNALRRFRSPW